MEAKKGLTKNLTTEAPIPWLDQSGLAALVAVSLVVLITFFTSYSLSLIHI